MAGKEGSFSNRAFQNIPMPGLLPTRESATWNREANLQVLTQEVEDCAQVREHLQQAMTQIEELGGKLTRNNERVRSIVGKVNEAVNTVNGLIRTASVTPNAMIGTLQWLVGEISKISGQMES